MHLPMHAPLARALADDRVDVAARRRWSRRATAGSRSEPERHPGARLLPAPCPTLPGSRRP